MSCPGDVCYDVEESGHDDQSVIDTEQCHSASMYLGSLLGTIVINFDETGVVEIVPINIAFVGDALAGDSFRCDVLHL